ncbi:restriction endonuclease subunit S [Anoxybacillus flavithermus]
MMSEYKKTPLGFLPQSWKVKKLRDVATRITEKNKDRTDNVLTISAKFGLVNQKEFFNKSVASKNLSGYYYLQKGDFAYNKSYSEGYPFGAIKMLERYDQGIVSTLYICFRLTGNNTDSLFYKYYFDSNLWNEEVRLIAKEGGRSHGLLNVGVDEFFDILLPLPPLEEQYKIAAILSSVDEAIEKTEAIIEQTEKVKKGLMQQLLTKGIGHTKFKKTEIGEIPEAWEVKSISEVAKVVSGGTPSKQVSEYWENGTIPWATPTDITSNDNKYISTTQLMITESGLRNSSANLLPEGSVLMTSRATIGPRCINTVPMATNQGFKSFICDPDVLHNEYLYYLIDKIKDQFIALASGSTFLEISKSAVETFKIPVPPLEEQIEIAKMLSSLDEKLSVEKVKKESLQTIKKALMQVLLTGKVRVKVDDEVMSQ